MVFGSGPVSVINFLCSSRLPNRPWFTAGTRLLQEEEHLEDAFRPVEELRERLGAAVGSEVLSARGGVKGAV